MIPGFAAAVAQLKAAGVDNPRLDARLLWAAAERAAGPTEETYRALLARRAAREPEAYIVGHKEFWGLDFAVGAGVLVPRPDSETLIEAVLKHRPDRARPWRLLDLGVGSGCLLAALLHEYPAARGTGVEASAVARDYASRNLDRLGLAERGQIRAANWCDGVSGAFDIVVSNPPYIRSADIPTLEPDVAEYEPAAALDGGPDGLNAYRALLAQLPRLLDRHGLAVFEIGYDQEAAVSDLARAAGLTPVEACRDLAGIVRALVLKIGFGDAVTKRP